MDESRLRRFAPLLIAIAGLILFFPGLTAFGLWDPYEIRVADAARSLVTGSWTWGPQLGHSPLTVWLVAAGFKIFGVGELGGRLPIAITAVLALLAVFYAGAPLVGRRGALFGTLALAVSPSFLLGARQLTSDVPSYLAAALAFGGMARLAWPEPDSSLGSRIVDALLALVGLTIGQFACGIFVGSIAPVGAVAVTLLLVDGMKRSTAMFGFVGLLALLCLRATLSLLHPAGYSAVLGGMPHAMLHTTTIATQLLRAGFQLFPWVALAPAAAMRALDATPSDRGPSVRRPLHAGTLLVAWATLTFVAGTVQAAAVQDLLLPIGIPLLLLVGGYLDELLADPTARPLPFVALVSALAAICLGRDFFATPEHFIGVHMLEQVRWPGPLTHTPFVIMAYAAFFAGTVGLGIGVPLAAPGASDEKKASGRRLLLGASAAGAFAFALMTTLYIVPQVSKHLSARDVYGKTKTLDPNAPVGQYRFNAQGASYYAGSKAPTTLATVGDVFNFLQKPEHVFVLAGSEELPNIDQEARQRKATYYVVDDTNSRYLVLSNRLKPGEQDLNPLRRFISETPPKPQHVVEANFDNKVKLLGYDLPPMLGRGQEFKIRLYFQVLAPVGGNYKVFIHFDGAGTRFNGDHVPLEGRFPTPNWVPGYYITDEHLMAPERAVEPAGAYRLFMGLFAGETRLRVIDGPQDGENRVKLGAVTIR